MERPNEASLVICIHTVAFDFSLPFSPAISDFYVPCQDTGVHTGYTAYVARSKRASLRDQAQPGSIK